jgi:hypothetical protein
MVSSIAAALSTPAFVHPERGLFGSYRKPG